MIYFIQNENTKAIKIGYTGGEVSRRVAQLQTSSSERLKLLGSIAGAQTDEAFLHSQFAACRLSGEWFMPHAELIRWIGWLSGRQKVVPVETGEPVRTDVTECLEVFDVSRTLPIKKTEQTLGDEESAFWSAEDGWPDPFVSDIPDVTEFTPADWDPSPEVVI